MYSKCSKKMGFDTKEEAQQAVTIAVHQHGSKLKVYKCRDCVLWHLSSRYEEDA